MNQFPHLPVFLFPVNDIRVNRYIVGFFVFYQPFVIDLFPVFLISVLSPLYGLFPARRRYALFNGPKKLLPDDRF